MTELIQTFISTFVQNIFDNFKQKEEQWCNLQNFDLHTSSYENELNQEYYLLKYFPAYFTEYYDAIDEFFKIYEKDSLKVVSIGCGAGIDFYALQFYIDTKGLDIEYKYKCIDIIDWNYKPNKNNFNFIHADINNTEDRIFDDVDLIIFPKILTELDTNTIEYIISLLNKSNLKDELYFLNSYITDDSHDSQRVNGIEHFKKICNNLKENGFKIDNEVDCNTYTYFKEHQGLRAIHNFFVYPDNIKSTLNILEDKCSHRQTLPECDECNIKIFPMMNTKYIAYLVIKFKK